MEGLLLNKVSPAVGNTLSAFESKYNTFDFVQLGNNLLLGGITRKIHRSLTAHIARSCASRRTHLDILAVKIAVQMIYAHCHIVDVSELNINFKTLVCLVEIVFNFVKIADGECGKKCAEEGNFIKAVACHNADDCRIP